MGYTPAANNAVIACDGGTDVPEGIWQLDFGKGWEKSRWNWTILRWMVDDLLEMCQQEGGWNTPDVSEDYLLGLFHGQLKCSHEAWIQVQPRFSMENRREETEEEAMN